MLRLTQGDHGVHRCAATLGELDIGHANPATTLADRRHQPHRPRIRRPQKARRHCDRLPHGLLSGRAVSGAGGIGTQRHHRTAVHLGPDGPVLVQLAFKNPARRIAGIGVKRAQRHRRGEQRVHSVPGISTQQVSAGELQRLGQHGFAFIGRTRA